MRDKSTINFFQRRDPAISRPLFLKTEKSRLKTTPPPQPILPKNELGPPSQLPNKLSQGRIVRPDTRDNITVHTGLEKVDKSHKKVTILRAKMRTGRTVSFCEALDTALPFLPPLR